MAKWTQEDKLKALAIAEASSAREASKQTGIPRGTILRWMSATKGDSSDSNQNESTNQNESHPQNETDTNGLTPKQRLFVKEYLVDLNATQAAIRAGYSEHTASEIGYEHLRKPQIAAAIQKAMEEREQRTEITADKVLLQLARIGFADIRDFVELDQRYDEMGELQQVVRMKPLDEIDGTIVTEISQTKDGIRFKRNDQLKALELIGRHLGMFNDKMEVKHSGEVTSVDRKELYVIQEVIRRDNALANRLIEGIRTARLGTNSRD